jgi:hypothetical protein
MKGLNKKITLVDSIIAIKLAWNDISERTIVNCWSHTVILENLECDEIVDTSLDIIVQK